MLPVQQSNDDHIDMQEPEIEEQREAVHLLASKIAFDSQSVNVKKVDYSKESSQFVFYENNDKIGELSIKQIIKYITKPLNEEGLFLNTVTNNDELVEKYIVVLENTPRGLYHFNLKKETEPIMSNYNMMIILSKSLIEFEEIELKKFVENMNLKIVFMIQRFIIILLEYIIKMIVVIMETQELCSESKKKLFHHAIILHGYSTKYISYKLQEHVAMYSSLHDAVEKLENLKISIENKQIKLDEKIYEQNSLLTAAIGKLNEHVEDDHNTINKSIKNLTEQIKHLTNDDGDDSNDSDNDNDKKQHKNTLHLITDTANDNKCNNFDENYEDSSTPINIQKIESSYSVLLNI